MRKIIVIVIFHVILFASSANAQIPKDWKNRAALLATLQSRSDSIYIQDRTKLYKIDDPFCGDSGVVFMDSSNIGGKISVLLLSKKCGLAQTKLVVDSSNDAGSDREIKTIGINWNDNIITIPPSVYSGLLNPSLCKKKKKGMFSMVEPYITPDGKYLYLYLSGNTSKGNYAIKFIFDRTHYITKMVDEHHSSNQYDFLDGKNEQ